MQESACIHIECPGCRVVYRIERVKIPEKGAIATCRKCQAKILIQNPAPLQPESLQNPIPPVPESLTNPIPQAPVPPVNVTETPQQPLPESQSENGVVCPRCGFKQVYPFRCYKCGFVLREQSDAVQQSPLPSSAIHKNQSPPAGQHIIPDSVSAELVVNTRFFPLMFLLFLVRPHIEIDGKVHESEWGRNRFKVTPGRHKISVYYPYFFIPRCGENSIVVDIKANETAMIDYHIWCPLVLVRGSIKRITA